jgi:hypothetical protein
MTSLSAIHLQVLAPTYTSSGSGSSSSTLRSPDSSFHDERDGDDEGVDNENDEDGRDHSRRQRDGSGGDQYDEDDDDNGRYLSKLFLFFSVFAHWTKRRQRRDALAFTTDFS